MKQYCQKCSQVLKTNLFGKVVGYEFEDGWYCEECARTKVKKAREK